MTLKDKKLIPYYIIGAVLIIISSVAVGLFAKNKNSVNQAEVIEKEESTIFMEGQVPYYPDVPANSYNKSAFRLNENGRIEYLDSNVKYSTGIDVSSHQGDIDWEKVAADGIDFAIIRVGFRGYGSAGKLCADDYGEKNIQAAADAGLKVGVYFYSQAITPEEAEEEARFVLGIIKKYKIDYPVVFDWENEADVTMRTDGMTAEGVTDCALSFCETVKSAGYTPAVYLNLSVAYRRINLSRIKEYPIWYAQHKGEQPEMYYNYLIWQYSDSGSVDGIKGRVDMNISFSDFK